MAQSTNLIEKLWQKTVNLNELKKHCEEEQAKNSPQCCERLIKSNRKQLPQVIAAEGGLTN